MDVATCCNNSVTALQQLCNNSVREWEFAVRSLVLGGDVTAIKNV